MPNNHQNIAVLSGGSAANSLVDVFEAVRRSRDCPLNYIIPISDNGGSSSELIRVFGGPGIGDVRSRLVRLIPKFSRSSPGYREREAIRHLFNFRLSSADGDEARLYWWGIVDGTSELWKDISSAKKELIRSIFNLVNLEIIKRSRPPSSTFDFTSASVGNLFLTGARLFTGSFESAIYLLGSICGINDEEVKVIPSINSNFSHHIAAGLEDETVIVGQNAISHPSPPGANGVVQPGEGSVVKEINGNRSIDFAARRESVEHYYGDEYDQEEDFEEEQEAEDANLPGTLPLLRTKNINFNKAAHLNEDLPARISRIWYINPYGEEILPPANPRAVTAINHAQTIIYSIGSLYTSLVPSLVLRGVGEAIKKTSLNHGKIPRIKIMILNGSLDREVGPPPPLPGSHEQIFTAIDFIEAIIRAGEQSRGIIWEAERNDAIHNAESPLEPPQTSSRSASHPKRPGLIKSQSDYITTTLRATSLTSPFIRRPAHLFPPPLLASNAPTRSASREPSPSPSQSITGSTPGKESLKSDNVPDPIYKAYVTHLLHLPNSAQTPYVDRDMLLNRYGIKCIEVRTEDESGGDGSTRYNPDSLRESIQAILG